VRQNNRFSVISILVSHSTPWAFESAVSSNNVMMTIDRLMVCFLSGYCWPT